MAEWLAVPVGVYHFEFGIRMRDHGGSSAWFPCTATSYHL